MTARFVYARTGVAGELGLFRGVTPHSFPRDAQAVCRTERGLEVATIVCRVTEDADTHGPVRGELLRLVSPQDELILQRLERHRLRALDSCQRLIEERGLDCVLLDVEHLFDGESLYFHFLGDVDEPLQEILVELAKLYEKRVGFRQFVDRLANGCGPGCGTTAARCGTTCAQCTSGGCGSLR